MVALFYWRITLTSQYDWMWSPDLAGQVLPWFQTQALQWHRHGFPMWDPYLWNGQPLFGQAQPGAAYPLNWLLFWMPLDAAGHIQSWALAGYFVAIHFMAAAFCYKLCRDLGRSFAASIFGAMIFTFAGYIGSTDWPQMLNGAVWMPLVSLPAARRGREAPTGKWRASGDISGHGLAQRAPSGGHVHFAGVRRHVDLFRFPGKPSQLDNGAGRGGFDVIRGAVRGLSVSSRSGIRTSGEAMGGRVGAGVVERPGSLLRA